MKSRVVNTFCAIRQRLPHGVSRLSQTGMALAGVVSVLALSGCYYPYGYYPAGYYPYYGTVPASATQQQVQVGPADLPGAQQQQQQAQQQQAALQNPLPVYAVAAPPVYAAPVYPAYYPPPVYPAYYGYPGWYGPSVSVGVGFNFWGGGHGCCYGNGHGHWH